MHVRETFCVFTSFVVCINYFLVYGDAIINYKFVFTNDRHQSTHANLSYSQCAHSLTAFLYNTFISKIIYFLFLEMFFLSPWVSYFGFFCSFQLQNNI